MMLSTLLENSGLMEIDRKLRFKSKWTGNENPNSAMGSVGVSIYNNSTPFFIKHFLEEI